MHSNSQDIRQDREYRKDPSKFQDVRKDPFKIYPKPSHFVALQVSNPEIHKAVLDVQKALGDANFHIAPEYVDVAKLHITLLVIRIENDEQLKDALTALDHCRVILSKKFTGSPVHLSFQGISNFSNKVIFAKLVEDDTYGTLKEIGNIVREEFSKMNVNITDKRDLNPHLTIARLLQRPSWRDRTSLPEINQKFHNYNFGSQALSGLQLLKMSDEKDKKDENGYYIMAKEVTFIMSENT